MSVSLFDARVRVLSRMSKAELVDVWHATHLNTVWTATPPTRWSKDELISEVLQAEFPGWGQ